MKAVMHFEQGISGFASILKIRMELSCIRLNVLMGKSLLILHQLAASKTIAARLHASHKKCR